MSNTIRVRAGQLAYCVECADVYGTIDGDSKRCDCAASGHLAEWRSGDFPTPFEICWYCQTEVIRSGSRFATYSCDSCRPPVVALNDALDKAGLVSLPVGRHNLQHTRWRHARPFTADTVVHDWKQRRLRQAWALYPSSDPDWFRFSAFMRGGIVEPARLEHVSLLVQEAEHDILAELTRKVNWELRGEQGEPQAEA